MEPTFCDVQVKEVAIQYGLDNTGHDGNQVEESLKVITVDPVDKVKGTVGTQGEQVVTCDGLCLSCLADHKELWQDSY